MPSVRITASSSVFMFSNESNASIKEPNPGLTYLGVVLRVALR